MTYHNTARLMIPSPAPTRHFNHLLAALLLTLPASAAVEDWFVTKVINYRQSADNTQPTSASAWIVEVAVLAAPGDATGATISGTGISDNLTYEDGEWLLDKVYASEAAMNAEFPSNSSYTITLSGGTLGTLSQSFTLGPANYPAIPYLAGPDLTRAHSIDATNDFILHWNSPGPDANAIWLEISDTITDAEAADYWIDSDPLPTSQVINGGTLNPGYTYEGDLGLVNSVENDGAGGFGVTGYLEHASSLVFDLNTVLSPAPQAIVGTWQFGNGAPDGSGVFVFQANGAYFHAEDIADEDEFGSDGMERGTYTWNENTGTLTITTGTDTNGEIGLSHPDGAFTASVDGDTLTLSDNSGPFTLSRIGISAGAPLAGGWQLCDNAGVNTGFIAFLNNATYFHAKINNGDPAGATGIERGTYNYDSGTNFLTATSITVDQNGEFGLSDPIIGHYEVSFPSPRVLDIYDGEDSTLHRISNASVLPDWRLNKGRTYNQTADNTAPSVAEFWDLYASVETRNATDATTVTLSGGNLPSPVTLTEDAPGDWTYEQDYTTQALLDADIPDSQNYTFTLSGGELGTISQTISSGSGSYPSIPHLTGTTFTDAQSIDPTEDFDFTWNAPAPIDAGVQFIVSSLPDEEGDELFAEFDSGSSGSMLPALSLPVGQSAYGYLEFGITSTNSSGAGGFGTSGFSGRQSITYNFSIDALGSTALVSAAAADAGLSGPDAEALATPFSDGVENLIKYAFNMNLGGADVSTLTPGSGSSGLPVFELDASGPATVFKVEFIRRKGSGLVYTAKSSPDLGAGSFVEMTGSVTVEDVVGNDQFERVTVSEPCDPSTTPRCFGIVEISAP